MQISIIVAASDNGVIGVRGQLPWHLPDDLKRFKAITMGKPIVMGRLTHESIGRPLPGRRNIVLTHRENYHPPGCDILRSVEAVLGLDEKEVMVIGGGTVYTQFLPHAERVYLTRVHVCIDGDAFFPELDPASWVVENEEPMPTGGDAPIVATYIDLVRSSD